MLSVTHVVQKPSVLPQAASALFSDSNLQLFVEFRLACSPTPWRRASNASHSEVSLVSWHLRLKPRTLRVADCVWRVNLQVRLVGTTWFSESMMQPGVVFFRCLLRSSWGRRGFSPVFTSSSNILTLFLKIFTCSPMSLYGPQCPHDSYGVLITSLSHVWVKTQQ